MLGKKNADTKMSTLIGAGAELTGDFTLDGSARIDGKIGGNVTVTGNLILGAGSIVTGDVQAASVLIGGEVTGNITAPEKAELTASAKVLGDIATKVIVIDEHAVFQGKIDMNQTVPDRKGKARTAKAVRAGRKSAKAAIAEALKEVEESAFTEEEMEVYDHFWDMLGADRLLFVDSNNISRKKGREEGLAEGLAEGRKEGLAEGELKGMAKERNKVARAMLDKGMEVSVIAELTGLDEDAIRSLSV